MKWKVTAQLIRQCQEGDPQAQEKLVRCIQNPVYFYCMRLIGSPEDAMDATQEILLAAVTGLPALRNPEAFAGWVDQIIVRTCCRWIRRQQMEARRPQKAADAGESPDPAELLDEKETRRTVVELVDALPAPQRLCVLMHYYGGMTVAEIASVLRIPENTIKSRLRYARGTIRKGLEREILPVLFLGWILRREADACAMDRETAARLIALILPGAAAGAAAKPLVLTGVRAAVLAGLVLAGTAGVLHQAPDRPAVPAEPAVSAPAAPVPAVPAPPAPERPIAAETPETPPPAAEIPVPVQITVSLPAELPEAPQVLPEPQPEAPPAFRPIPAPDLDPYPEPDMDPVPPDPDPDPEPESEPEPEPEVRPSSGSARPSWEPSHWPQPAVPSEPEDPGPEKPDPPQVEPEKPDPPQVEPEKPDPPDPVKPDPPAEEQPAVVTQTFVDQAGNGGYGYTYTFGHVWQDELPEGPLTYSSTNSEVVAINQEGEFSILAPGTAVLSAVAEDKSRYELRFTVEDRFRWQFSLPDAEIQAGETALCGFRAYNFGNLAGYQANVEQVEWTSSNPAVAEPQPLTSIAMCEVQALSPGMATITAQVTFRVETTEGIRTMEDTCAFDVTVEPAPEAPVPPGPETPDVPEEPENPVPENPGPGDPEHPDPPPDTEPEEPPEEPGQEEPDAHRKELTEFGIHSGYGYQSTFAKEWADALPEGLTYASSDESVVKIHEATGAFYTVSGGTATLTAKDPAAPDDPYILTVRVQDAFEWTYTADDLDLAVREEKTYDIPADTLPAGAWPLGCSWSRSDNTGISLTGAGLMSCNIMGNHAGTYTVTCKVTFDLMTYERYVQMSTSFSFQVTVVP